MVLVLVWALDARPHWGREWSGLQWSALAASVLFLGGGAFLSFDGDFWTRAGLASLAPAVAPLLGEAAFGSELAFPGFSLALAAASAVVCFLGSLLVAGPAFLWKRNRNRRAGAGPRIEIHAATVGEARALSRLALESKAQWGYSRSQLGVWESGLRLAPDSIERLPTFVAEVDGEIAGFYQLATAPSPWELEHFWVRPRFMRRRIGRAMMSHAMAFAADAGQAELAIDSDPNAELFYLALGARRVDVIPAPTDDNPTRVRPRLRLAIERRGSRTS